MIRWIFSLTLCWLASLSYASELSQTACAISDDNLGLQYRKITRSPDGNSKKVEAITLWRNGNQVAIANTSDQVTDLWEKVPGNRMRLVRYFDGHRRGIEYQPSEIRLQGTQDEWLERKQLISDRQIQQMSLGDTAGDGCYKIQTYRLADGKKRLSLKWYPELGAIKAYTVKAHSGSILWELEQVISDPQKVAAYFQSLSGYQTTDYADIGDNESDPFLMKMINLGFVSHGASGFYDAEGNLLQGDHAH